MPTVTGGPPRTRFEFQSDVAHWAARMSAISYPTSRTSPKLSRFRPTFLLGCFLPTFSARERCRRCKFTAMASSTRKEPITDPTNTPSAARDEETLLSEVIVGESGGERGERQRLLENRVDLAAPSPASIQQNNFRLADSSVFGKTEEELKKHDERERLLAESYRRKEKLRKEVANTRRALDGITNYRPVGSDLDTNDDQSCYIEIKNLVLIENSVIHKKALKEWDRKEKLFASRVERKSTKVGSLKNEVYQLVGFFSVFQGVVLTAVSQSNLLHCNNLWSPIVLSLLASIVTIAGVAQKLMQISSLEETIYSEEQALKDVVRRGQDLRREGKDFVFAKFSENKKKGSKEGYFGWYAFGVLGFLLLFTAAFPLSHWRILCHPGRNPYGGA